MCNNEISAKTEVEKEDSLSSLEIEKQKDTQSQSTYIIKYTRKKAELKELIEATQLPKAKQSLFMLELILIKNNDKSNESLLHIKCHEIAAVHFEDYYERIYSYSDISKENRYFKALDNIEEIKDALDYVLSQNFKNSKKIFIELKNNTFILHVMLSYFDTIKEIILTVPQKILKEEEKILLLPMAMKEIQQKITFYEKENKKIKNKEKKNDSNEFNCTFYDYYLMQMSEKEKIEKKEKEKEEENNQSYQQSIVNETYDTSYNSITSEEKRDKKEKIKKKKKKKNFGVKAKEKEFKNENNEIKFVNNFF
jgi:hypothetical protein